MCPISVDRRVGTRFARGALWQAAVIAAVVVVAALMANQTAANLKARGIASGFAYLDRAAGFEIAYGPLSYSSRDSFARALAVGLVNTLRVALAAIALATVLGVTIGIARLSRLWVVAAASRAYVEVMRNTPLLLQLLFWYSLSQTLPGPHAALHPLPGVFLTGRGVFVPWPALASGGWWPSLEYPALARFNFHGGLSISPEFAAVLIGLSTSTAAFIAEIVRGGVLAVDRGQTEAAAALGLSRLRILRLVVLPQALPVMVPPTISQFVNVAKNSSLAVAIGYPELTSVTNTTLNQTGQAIEAIALASVLYLGICLTISLGTRLSAARGRRSSRIQWSAG
jgi:general L-amino acid transport system permease protein